MTIYVDNMRMLAVVGKLRARWSHLFSDSSVEELNEFADKLGMKHSWIQNSRGMIHYDLTDSMRTKAIQLGAVEIEYMDLPDYWLREKGEWKFKNPPVTSDSK